MFNFNGYTGRFNINEDGLVLTPPSQTLKIEITTSYFGTGSNFEITTPDGVKYLFADKEKTNNGGGCAPSTGTYFYTTSWYLSKISHPNGDVINFIYETETYIYMN